MHKIADIDVQHDILKANEKLAQKNQKLLDDANVYGIDLLGAIGSGKTSLLEKIVESVDYPVAAIAGDVISKYDAGRLEEHNIPVVGLNTGKECHLDAHLVEHGIEDLPLEDVDVLFIENVGNLICPVDFDLGAHLRIVVISVSEGDDTVEKHPLIFKQADVVIINKIDIAEAVGADKDKMVEDVNKLNPEAKVITCSLKTGEGFDEILKTIDDARNE